MNGRRPADTRVKCDRACLLRLVFQGRFSTTSSVFRPEPGADEGDFFTVDDEVSDKRVCVLPCSCVNYPDREDLLVARVRERAS